MSFDAALLKQAADLLAACRARGEMIVTAESCTGGLIAGVLTAIAGSSDVVERGFVVYSNRAKEENLGVDPAVIARSGAVSEAVARAMAEGALTRAPAGLAIACTGVAGPGGGSKAKPVGRVHIAVARSDGPTAHRRMDYGDIGRDEVRIATVRDALALAAKALGAKSGGRKAASANPAARAPAAASPARRRPRGR
jgi:nicotinamide-nucleotide amidase